MRLKQRIPFLSLLVGCLMLGVTTQVFGQNTQTVSGTVTDAQTGAPLIGANILVVGTSTGTTTDADGHYSLTVLSLQDSLRFSYIGYQTQTIAINGRKTINVKMIPTVFSGQQMVVIGFGKQKKSDITSAITHVDLKKTADIPNYNVLQSLEGQVAGLHVTAPTRPGQSPDFRIRGVNSISASTKPLVVIDGIIYHGNLSDFNPNSFSGISVLKGPSAVAIYGSRAANGVILLTSRSGTSKKPKFHFSTNVGFQRPTHLIPVLSGPEYIQKVIDYQNAIGNSADLSNVKSYLTPVEAKNYQNGHVVNWLDSTVTTGILDNYHLDVSGSSKKTSYYLGATYLKNSGIIKNDDFNRLSLNLNMTNHLTDWYSLTTRAKFSSQDRSGQAADLSQAYRQSPYGSFYDKNGPGGLSLHPVGDPLGINPIVPTLANDRQIRTTFWGLVHSNLDVPFIPGLNYTLNYSINIRRNNHDNYQNNKISRESIVANGIGFKHQEVGINWTFNNILHYRKTINRVHSLYATFLFGLEGARDRISNLRGENFFTQVLGYSDLGIAKHQFVTSNFGDQNTVSVMGRINYSYKSKYAVTLTIRRDGFSGFSENHKFGTFPSVAVAWTVSNENFLNDIPWLSLLKLRLSYGKNGNQAVNRYQSLPQLISNKYVFGNKSITTIHQNTLGNPDLTWETTIAKNLGIDFGFLKDRVNGSINLYYKKTKNLLLQRALPLMTGFNNVLTNIGSVSNKGIGFSINSSNFNNNNWSWKSHFVFSLNRNKIEHLTGGGDDIRDAWFIGHPVNVFYGYKTDGIYQLKDKKQGKIPPGYQPGDVRIVDTNDNDRIDGGDREILGTSLPNYSFGISNTIKYKNISLYVMIRSVQGGGKNNYYIGNNTNYFDVNAIFTSYSARYNLVDVPYWTPQRPSNRFPRVDYSPPFEHPVLEDFLQDRGYVRIQDVTLSYTLNEKALEKIGLRNLKIFLNAKNLYTWTKWKGYDPGNATTLGDFPFLRTYTIGIDFSF